MIRYWPPDYWGTGRRNRPTIAAGVARHEPALGDQRDRGRFATHRSRRPGPDLRDDRTGRQGRAVLTRGAARAGEVLVVAAARPFHQCRPSVCAFRPRLSRGNAFLPYV